MKKMLLLSLCASFALAGFINPLPTANKAKENGGTLDAIDAYKDGVGAMMVTEGRGVDNSAMNTLVFKYGIDAKDNTINLCDQVVLSGNNEDKMLNSKLCADGTNCNDGLSNTINDVFLSGSCIGKIVTSPICGDAEMAWNGVSNLCEKGGISTYAGTYNNSYSCPSGGTLSGTTCLKSSTYAATNDIAGYTISGDSISSIGPFGLEKNGNTFRFCWSGICGAYVFLKTDGSLSGNSLYNSANTQGIYTVPNGFVYKNTTMTTAIITRSGTSITGNSGISSQGISKIDSNSFRMVNVNFGNPIQFVPFYSGYTCPSGGTLSGTTCTLNQDYTAINSPYYTCPSGGTLSGTTCTINTFSTAPGICQSGYTMNNFQCIQN